MASSTPTSATVAPTQTFNGNAPSTPNPSSSSSSTEAPSTTSASASNEPLIRLGVAAMDRKARSRPMRNILSRLLATQRFEITVFGDKVILDEVGYVELRKPVCVNDLPLQKVFWDRRVVLQILDRIGVPTPKRLECNRDGGPQLDPSIADTIQQNIGVRVDKPRPKSEVVMKDEDTIVVDGKAMTKPFVEKPVSGEDHNVNIYFAKKKGGGARRLFRKVGNQSSAFEPTLTQVRMDGSYVYEQFVDVENAEDIKVYTLGPNFVHAETRKSPVVDGLVRRNTEGKEIRFICQLTDAEKKMARDISVAFKQNICGFDLLRAGGKSYVIDVNGWSFVKGNDFYYDKCAEILSKFCERKMPSVPKFLTPGSETPREKSWVLKSTICVGRHGDRTPKCKLKFTFKGSQPWTQPFITLLQGRTNEIILREPDQLQYIADAAEEASSLEGADKEQLEQLRKIIEKKKNANGTKAQLKPAFKDDGTCEKVAIVVKWGGEFTHAARYQARDIAENMRKGEHPVRISFAASCPAKQPLFCADFLIMNKSLFDHTNVYSSSERRVVATAEIFTTAFMDDKEAQPDTQRLIIRKDLLDDSNAAKDEMEKVKKRLKILCRPGAQARPEFAWPLADQTPFEVVKETIELMRHHRAVMHRNWESLAVEKIQIRWCCGEYPYLFRERWEALFADWCDVELEKFDPSRVSELYDSLKYDALHNRVFLETIFGNGLTSRGSSLSLDSRSSEKEDQSGPPKKLRELYKRAKLLFDLIAPQEYGIEKSEKEEIGLLTSLPLLEQLIKNLKSAREETHASANFYFTKESHIHTLVNLVTLSELPIVMPQVPELDYMSYLAFEVYERTKGDTKELSVRVSLSEGAHSAVLDASLDAKHALQVQPRRALTDYLDLDVAIETLGRHSVKAEAKQIKKSTTKLEGLLPIEGDEIFKGAQRQLEEIREFKPNRPGSLYSAGSEKGE
ncbi:BQ2448_4921 [Microbotryum intermedium]|uniref:Inositol hexakisphosphate and diphosphoinositol-pentakisphosphate kinase n=1 Tax=Microbotryum intermedium TaxID=269621 RepID=A0A238FG68_9BASI|nr:BQ2448_4921 [Microbotryum intermedium]